MFQIGDGGGVHESTAQRIVCKVEQRLLASGRFKLPPRDRALALGEDLELVLMDATESPIERPKKNSGATIAARKNAILSRPNC